MNDKNRHLQPFIMVLVATVGLLVASQFNTSIKLWGYQAKKIAPFSDIILKEKAKTVPLPLRILADSIIAKDDPEPVLAETDITNIYDYNPDRISSLAPFFESLNKIKKQKHKVRIAYFGDSMIEGDLITQDLRDCMQNTFGGYGVGFVPVTSIVAGFRTSIIHSFEGWKTYNLLEKMPANHLLGISGYTFVPELTDAFDSAANINNCWVKYVAVKKRHLNKFPQTKLLYGKSTGENYVVINSKRYKLSGTKTVNELMIDNENNCQCVNAKFQCRTSIDVFGFSTESDSGVFVDNFSFRGNSGMPITKVSKSVYSGTNECLNYDLVILEYGLNVVSERVTDYSWYEKGMNNVIKHIQESFPGTSILLISVGDKGYKDDVYKTNPGIPFLVEVQKRLAANNKIAFWSLYDAMGGNGSMIKWVEGDTTFANKDYAHFNFKGAHKVGRLLFNKLMVEYSDYNKKKLQP
ncbi:MAG: hypothetical protein H0W84_11100 [Bacteroidetes bacterium]|nr:hypothetical protein [Bacteroidota bacterium]